MSDWNARFEKAAEAVQALRPDSNTKLKLYGLFKQATQGDVPGERPGGFDFVGQAKYDAWSAVKGTSKAAAMQEYVDLVKSLQN
jgi:acyl-CoA-binding protein